MVVYLTPPSHFLASFISLFPESVAAPVGWARDAATPGSCGLRLGRACGLGAWTRGGEQAAAHPDITCTSISPVLSSTYVQTPRLPGGVGLSGIRTRAAVPLLDVAHGRPVEGMRHWPENSGKGHQNERDGSCFLASNNLTSPFEEFIFLIL